MDGKIRYFPIGTLPVVANVGMSIQVQGAMLACFINNVMRDENV